MDPGALLVQKKRNVKLIGESLMFWWVGVYLWAKLRYQFTLAFNLYPKLRSLSAGCSFIFNRSEKVSKYLS